MSEITGTLTEVQPVNGGRFAAGATVDASAKGEVTIPAAEGGVQDDYRLSVTVSVYSEETCSTGDSTVGNSYTEAFAQETYQTSKASRDVSGDGGYLLTATLASEKKKPDGTFEPKVVLDTKTISFQVGNTGCSPQVYFCTEAAASNSSSSGGSPDSGCTAPVPSPGSTIPPGNASVSCKVKFSVVGNALCTKKYRFVYKLEVSGPATGSTSSFVDTGPGLVSDGVMIPALVSRWSPENIQRRYRLRLSAPTQTIQLVAKLIRWVVTLGALKSRDQAAPLAQEIRVHQSHRARVHQSHRARVHLSHRAQVHLNHRAQVHLNHRAQIHLNHRAQVHLNHRAQVHRVFQFEFVLISFQQFCSVHANANQPAVLDTSTMEIDYRKR